VISVKRIPGNTICSRPATKCENKFIIYIYKKIKKKSSKAWVILINSYIYVLLHNARPLLRPSSRHGSCHGVYVLRNLLAGECHGESPTLVRVEGQGAVSGAEVPCARLGVESEGVALGEGELAGRREGNGALSLRGGGGGGGGGGGPL
jgi:hypothetical protein